MTQDRFTGQVAVITGASRGIGLGIAQRLVAEGARVCITGRNQEALDAAVAELGGPEKAMAVAGKADREDHQADTVARTLDTFGRLDLLVNNAGINPVFGPLIELELGAARKIFEVNALAALAWTQHAHKAWLGQHGGAVLNVASIGGMRPPQGIGFYGASKAMLIHLTQQLALELAPDVRVNALAPAVVKTRFAAKLYEDNEAEVAAHYPLKRLGIPSDISGAAAFLLSADAAWLTGQTIVIDGGVTLTGGV